MAAKTYNGVSYDPNVDYSRLMQAAADANQFGLAKTYESKRNAKIAGEGLDY